MSAKADLLRVLQDVSRSEEAIRADCLSIARRRKMSTEAITRVGTEVGVALRTSRKPVNVEEAVTHLVRERLKATKSMEGTAIDPTQDVSTVEQEENDEDTVSPSATPVHTPDVVAMIHTLAAHISELQTELADLKAMFISERAEARDREQRQKNKITQLEKILNTHVESIDKTNDMACTMLKSIDAKTTTVISDLKKAGSAVRSLNRSTPGTYASMRMQDNKDGQQHWADVVRRHTEMDLPKRRSPPGPSKAPMMTNHPPPSTNDEDDDELWTLVAGSKPTGKKAVVYVGNLKRGAKEDEVREFIQKRCAKLRLRPPKIYNSKMFEKEPEEGEIIEFSCARLTIDYGSLESICDRQFWPGRSYARPWKFNGQNMNTPDDSTKN